ncbi:protein chibby homolog 1 isoform X2 [Dunckerocampus dactyliophorus]|nr:protein chibby homolog 1 isoform X2 [Dunckerocampus dactyliophorus]XP_054623972.1 protein chibby homolog 1 isoform X2 [Dunckerocampus dactyliophorus]XP_054623973.1 protein chibby homolog 1 isoform X2 [Dunckerocampus dactyliophorus]XP_054623974.1 protein chibby homolog 1 isoform X2 [Dunckerocampus dactyliophorus]XP_054623975.1 protein chibby homolog 1 isoform X2 [Dunckerocampus dactyliophorus]
MSLKLPLFGKTFSPKKIPPRKSASLSSLHTLDRSTREIELGLEYGPPIMNVGGHTLKFEDGQWITESGGNVSVREVERLKKRNIQLEEENNVLKLKIEILLDMLTQSTVDYHLMEKEVQEITPLH